LAWGSWPFQGDGDGGPWQSPPGAALWDPKKLHRAEPGRVQTRDGGERSLGGGDLPAVGKPVRGANGDASFGHGQKGRKSVAKNCLGGPRGKNPPSFQPKFSAAARDRVRGCGRPRKGGPHGGTWRNLPARGPLAEGLLGHCFWPQKKKKKTARGSAPRQGGHTGRQRKGGGGNQSATNAEPPPKAACENGGGGQGAKPGEPTYTLAGRRVERGLIAKKPEHNANQCGIWGWVINGGRGNALGTRARGTSLVLGPV